MQPPSIKTVPENSTFHKKQIGVGFIKKIPIPSWDIKKKTVFGGEL